MELRQWKYFVAVAEEGGFGRAAERLNIVQSAVSQQVRRLERSLGVALFDRTTRRVRLSGAGERLLPEAYAVLAAADRARQVAADIAAGRDGVLRLGTVQGPGDRIYRLVGELSALVPKLQVQLRRLPVAERLAAVRTGELDAALVRAAPTAPTAHGLELLEVWRDPLYAAVPADHPLADLPVLGLDALSALPLRLAAREHNPPFHDLVRRSLREAGAEPPQGPPFTDLQATLTAIGAAAEPSWTVFYEVGALPQLPRVALRPLAAPSVPTSLALPPGPPTPPVRVLLQALRTLGPVVPATK
ncbi:LysR family transcriptional regulator [Streptomyces spiroverticillatus]|uniref:LysR family transcriptional regulator n=1 Tax=Streptomyces finlayi TaxID=67296 RepID=A0A919C8B1_9ACTN|nr:LysR family transcriptional regulator [Streptomyces finlayi]GGZ96988.1 LysR family transcriptional regulator [Streptomyces spiroverticillatus]GHC82223.1 LysR family transcriptional regulator [Streptomyces finlayi]